MFVGEVLVPTITSFGLISGVVLTLLLIFMIIENRNNKKK